MSRTRCAVVYAEEVSNSCEIRVAHNGTPSWPIVCVNLVRKFNEIVASRLIGGLCSLHMIEVATRLSNSRVTESKECSEIVGKIMETWSESGLGVLVQFSCDNGMESATIMFLEI